VNVGEKTVKTPESIYTSSTILIIMSNDENTEQSKFRMNYNYYGGGDTREPFKPTCTCKLTGTVCYISHQCTQCNIPIIQALKGAYPG